MRKLLIAASLALATLAAPAFAQDKKAPAPAAAKAYINALNKLGHKSRVNPQYGEVTTANA